MTSRLLPAFALQAPANRKRRCSRIWEQADECGDGTSSRCRSGKGIVENPVAAWSASAREPLAKVGRDRRGGAVGVAIVFAGLPRLSGLRQRCNRGRNNFAERRPNAATIGRLAPQVFGGALPRHREPDSCVILCAVANAPLCSRREAALLSPGNHAVVREAGGHDV